MWINTRPSLRWRSTRKILMRPDMVIEEAEFIQCAIERIEGGHRELVKARFQRTKEPFHPSILPGAMQISFLMADAEKQQRKLKHAGSKNCFVVGSNHLWCVKYEDVYLKGYATMAELLIGLTEYFVFYNTERPHQSLSYSKPDRVYQTANGGGAEIVDKYIKAEKAPVEKNPNRGSAVQLQVAGVHLCHCLIIGIHYRYQSTCLGWRLAF